MTSTASNEIPPGVSLNHPHGSMQASIDKLRELTIASAENGESDDLGVVIIEDGNESEALVPVFVGCTWPADAKSRHVLIWMKPSAPSDAFGSAVNEIFQVIEAGGVFKDRMFIWDNGNPFTHDTDSYIAARDTVRRAVGIDAVPTRKQVVKMMGETGNEIMLLVAEPIQNAQKCFICDLHCVFFQRNMDLLRKLAFKPRFHCESCLEERGGEEVKRLRDRAEADDVRRARDGLINPKGHLG